jgi:hypothetical protein
VRELIGNVEHAELEAIMGAIFDEVIGPDVIGGLQPQTDARSVSSKRRTKGSLLVADLEARSDAD